jgi:hypothetical protein
VERSSLAGKKLPTANRLNEYRCRLLDSVCMPKQSQPKSTHGANKAVPKSGMFAAGSSYADDESVEYADVAESEDTFKS